MKPEEELIAQPWLKIGTKVAQAVFRVEGL